MPVLEGKEGRPHVRRVAIEKEHPDHEVCPSSARAISPDCLLYTSDAADE